jgi:hypothetical protein
MEIKKQEIIDIVVLKGKVRKSKPNDLKSCVMGDAAYVWRNVAFILGISSQAKCIPVMADCYIWDSEDAQIVRISYSDPNFDEFMKPIREARKARMKELDKIVDEIVDSFPKSQWRGIHVWANALGY